MGRGEGGGGGGPAERVRRPGRRRRARPRRRSAGRGWRRSRSAARRRGRGPGRPGRRACPTSIVPVVVEVVHVRRARGVRGQRARPGRAPARAGTAVGARLVRARRRLTATWMPASGSGLLTGQSLPAASRRAGAQQVAERVLPGGALGPEERDGQLVHLRLVGRPQRLDVGGRAELARTAATSSGWTTWRWARWWRGSLRPLAARAASTASRPRGRRGRRARGSAPGSRAASSCGHVPVQQPRGRRTRARELPVAQPQPSRYGLEHRGGEVLGDAVLHDLHASSRRNRPAAVSASRRATRSAICSAPAVAVPPQGADHPGGERAVGRGGAGTRGATSGMPP